MIKTFVLIYYIASISVTGGMTSGTAEYGSFGECERAGKQVKEDFASPAIRVIYICTPKTSIPVAQKH